jgi:hypothetical protein
MSQDLACTRFHGRLVSGGLGVGSSCIEQKEGVSARQQLRCMVSWQGVSTSCVATKASGQGRGGGGAHRSGGPSAGSAPGTGRRRCSTRWCSSLRRARSARQSVSTLVSQSVTRQVGVSRLESQSVQRLVC